MEQATSASMDGNQGNNKAIGMSAFDMDMGRFFRERAILTTHFDNWMKELHPEVIQNDMEPAPALALAPASANLPSHSQQQDLFGSSGNQGNKVIGMNAFYLDMGRFFRERAILTTHFDNWMKELHPEVIQNDMEPAPALALAPASANLPSHSQQQDLFGSSGQSQAPSQPPRQQQQQLRRSLSF